MKKSLVVVLMLLSVPGPAEEVDVKQGELRRLTAHIDDVEITCGEEIPASLPLVSPTHKIYFKAKGTTYFLGEHGKSEFGSTSACESEKNLLQDIKKKNPNHRYLFLLGGRKTGPRYMPLHSQKCDLVENETPFLLSIGSQEVQVMRVNCSNLELSVVCSAEYTDPTECFRSQIETKDRILARDRKAGVEKKAERKPAHL